MASDRSFRQRLRATVLEANTPAGKIYNLVIFGAILHSVVVLLLEPNPLGNSALQQTEVLWINLVQDSCLAVFAGDFVLHLAVVPSPRKYLFSFTGLIDLSAVLFFFVPQVRSELLLWVFKFGRILRVFKLLKFIDEAKLLALVARQCTHDLCVPVFCVSAAGGAGLRHFCDRKCWTELPVRHGVQRAVLGDRHDDHGWLRRCGAADRFGPVVGLGCDDARLWNYCDSDWDSHRLRDAASPEAVGWSALSSMRPARASTRRAAL